MCRLSRAVATLWLLLASAAGAEESLVSTDAVKDFAPFASLIKSRCIDCHSGDFPRGGLSLASKESAADGGDSGNSILKPALEENELWSRLTDEDPVIRMPKGSPPLEESDLKLVRAWIEAGCPWPAGETIEPLDLEEATGQRAIDAKAEWYDRIPFLNGLLAFEEQARILPYRQARLIGLLVIAIVVLILERRRQRLQKSPDVSETGNASAGGMHAVTYLLVLLIGVLATFSELRHRQYVDVQRDLADLREQQKAKQARARGSADEPPVPIRMRHARGLSKTYYRGNCETNDDLFNQGNYRTASFEIRLINQAGEDVRPGEPVPDDGLFVEVTLVRSRGSAESLFSEGVIKNTFLTTRFYGKSTVSNDEHRRFFEEVEPMQQWRVTYPVASIQDETGIHGPIYICKGSVSGADANGQAHYVVVCEIDVEDGRIAESADIWMDALFLSAAMPREQGRLPPGEWFDSRPIPEIEGENTDDPELLGLPEHLGRDATTGESDSPVESSVDPGESNDSATATE